MKNEKEIKSATNQEFYYAVYDKQDSYNTGECLENFDTEEEALDFVNDQNAAYGYKKFFYKIEEIENED